MSDDFITESVLRTAGLNDAGIAKFKAGVAELTRAVANFKALVMPHLDHAVNDLNDIVGQINQRMNG